MCVSLSCTTVHAGAANAVRCHAPLPQVIWCPGAEGHGSYGVTSSALWNCFLSLVPSVMNTQAIWHMHCLLHANLKHALQSAYWHASLVVHVGRPPDVDWGAPAETQAFSAVTSPEGSGA